MLRFASIAVLVLGSSLASAETKPAKQVTELEHTRLPAASATSAAAATSPAELQRAIVATLTSRIKASESADPRAAGRNVISLDRWLAREKK